VALIQRGTCDFVVKVENAKAAGATAAIIFNEGQEGRTDIINGTLGRPASIPALGTTFAMGEELYNLARSGETSVRIVTQTVGLQGLSRQEVIQRPHLGCRPGRARGERRKRRSPLFV
jgi:Zn-dependent M28 family amino/carboxypeptidase